jgi:hypothetical protein
VALVEVEEEDDLPFPCTIFLIFFGKITGTVSALKNPKHLKRMNYHGKLSVR